MCYFFFSQLCVDRLGWRGYTPVRDNGEIVRCGTLMLGEIRKDIVEQRERRNAKEAHDRLSDIDASFGQSAELQAPGVSRLSEGEQVSARAGVGGDDPRDISARRAARGSRSGRAKRSEHFPTGQIVDRGLVVFEHPHTRNFASVPVSALCGNWRIGK